MKTVTTTQSIYSKTLCMLRDHGYHVINSCRGPNSSAITFYAGPKGVVVMQSWIDGTCITYGQHGNTWEAFDAAL